MRLIFSANTHFRCWSILKAPGANITVTISGFPRLLLQLEISITRRSDMGVYCIYSRTALAYRVQIRYEVKYIHREYTQDQGTIRYVVVCIQGSEEIRLPIFNETGLN